MRESISTDLDDTEFVQTLTTKAVEKKMIQHSNTINLGGSSSGEILDSMTSKQPAEVTDQVLEESSSNPDSATEDEVDDFDSDWEDLSPSLIGNYDPVSGEVVDLVDDQLACSLISQGLVNAGSVPDGVLEQVADRLRMIGDEMDSDIRRNRMSGRRRATGLPVRGIDVIVDLFPMPSSTSRKNLVVAGDFACETLTRDLVRLVARRALVAAGSAIAHALFRELVSSTVTCPVNFRLKWSAIKWTRWTVW